MKLHIVCAGDCGVDFYLNDRTRWTGGCTLNVATNLAGLFARDSVEGAVNLSIISVLGVDWDSRDIQNQISDVVPLSKIQRIQGSPPMQTIELMPDGERRFRCYDEGVLGQWHLDPGQRDALATADFVMVPVFTQFAGALSQIVDSCAPERLIIDFMDLNDYGPDDPLVHQLVRKMHTGFFGLDIEDVQKIDAVRKLSQTGPGLFVVTLGRSGSLLMQNGEIRLRCPAVPVNGAVNTTGAGDAFAAAFVHACQRYGTDLFALQRAAEHAAAVISGANKVARFIGGG